MDSVKIGATIKNLRGERRMDVVAHSLGISKSALSMYERGERIPRDEVKIKIANFFDRSVQEIFFTTNEHDKCLNSK